jgi:hypothetical protein
MIHIMLALALCQACAAALIVLGLLIARCLR